MDEVVSYSIPDLLRLLIKKQGEKLELQVGLPPLLVIKRENFEVEGPPITDDVAEVLLHSVADSRQIREFRERGVTEFIYGFQRSRFLVRAVKEYGDVRLEFDLVTT